MSGRPFPPIVFVLPVLIGAFFLGSGCAPPGPASPDETTPAPVDRSFSVVVFPDIQFLTLGYPHILDAMVDFVLAERERRDIRMVVQQGDITHENSADEWVNATASLGRLNGVVPYAVCVGNHDMADGDTSLFNAHFGPSGYGQQPTFAGRREDSTLDDHFHTFTVGDVDWLVLSLSWDPRDDVLAWADGVLQDHPRHRVLVLTHAHLGPGGVRTAIGERIWEQALRQHPQVSFVLNGHYTGGEGARAEAEGDGGNAVQELFSNFQTRPLGGVGILRVMEFDPDARTVSVETFSPYSKLVLDEDAHQFTLSDLELGSLR